MRRSARSIGAELRAARLKGGLTQADLAARSGVSRQWVISVESGSSRAEIGLVMRAAEALGLEITLATMSTGADTPRTLSDLATPTARELAKNAPQVHEIVRDSKASNVRVFGSVARGEDNDASDIDLMVDLDPDADLVDLSMMSHRLRQLLGREVDVVPADQLRPAVDETAGTGAVAL